MCNGWNLWLICILIARGTARMSILEYAFFFLPISLCSSSCVETLPQLLGSAWMILFPHLPLCHTKDCAQPDSTPNLWVATFPPLFAWPFDRVWHGAISFNKLPQVHLVPAFLQVCMCGRGGGGEVGSVLAEGVPLSGPTCQPAGPGPWSYALGTDSQLTT